MLLLLLTACPPNTEVDCRALCLDMESTAIAVVAGGGAELTSEEWRASCDASAAQTECEACYSSLQDTLETYSIGMECGCGFDANGVRECLRDPELSDADALALIETCEQTCSEY